MYHGDELTAEAEAIFIELVADRFFAKMAKMTIPGRKSDLPDHRVGENGGRCLKSSVVP